MSTTDTRAWNNETKRRWKAAMQELTAVHERLGQIINHVDKIDPTNLAASVAVPRGVEQSIAELVDVAKRLAILDVMREIEPIVMGDAED